MRTIDRYVLQELGVPFGLSLAALTFILLTREIIRLVELLINKGIGLVPLLKTFFILLPSFFVLTLPMACLIASISAFSRLSSDHELTALQATGISVGRLVRPLLLFSGAVFVATLVMGQFAQPWGGQSLKKLALVMLRGQLSMVLDEGVFNTPADNVVVYIPERGLPDEPRGAFIADTRVKGEPRIIAARDWAVINDQLHNRIGMRLNNGVIHVNPKDPGEYRMIRFTSYDFKLDLAETQTLVAEERPSIFEIRYQLAETQGTEPRYLRLLEDEYKKLAFPTATLVFGLIGMPLGIVVKRSGRTGGFAVGVLIILGFYVLNVLGDLWVVNQKMSPFVAAWFPSVVFAMIAGLLFLRRQRL